jgi:hypothetical protein
VFTVSAEIGDAEGLQVEAKLQLGKLVWKATPAATENRGEFYRFRQLPAWNGDFSSRNTACRRTETPLPPPFPTTTSFPFFLASGPAGSFNGIHLKSNFPGRLSGHSKKSPVPGTEDWRSNQQAKCDLRISRPSQLSHGIP